MVLPDSRYNLCIGTFRNEAGTRVSNKDPLTIKNNRKGAIGVGFPSQYEKK